MPDYNIYIHALGGNTPQSNPTVPQDNQVSPNGTGEGGQGFDNFTMGAGQIGDMAKNGMGSTINTGIAMLGRMFPVVAAALFLAKCADKTLATGFGHLESYTGNYEFSMGYNNFKTAFANAYNPVGMISKEIQRNVEYVKQNKRLEQERTLIGRSYLNKIGV